LKKVSDKALSVLLALMIALPLVIAALPVILNPPLVNAASSAAIALDKNEGYVTDFVTVTGSGFTPNKDVRFMWGDYLFSSLGFIACGQAYQRPSIAHVSTGEVHTDALGNSKVQLQVPSLTNGTYTIKADDTVTSATASFTVKPLIKLRNEYAYKTHGSVELNPSDNPANPKYIDFFLAEGFVYDQLVIQLSGFGRGETVEVKMGTTKIGDFIVGTAVWNEGYKFQTGVRVPNIPGGTYTVTATGKISSITASTTFTVKPELFLSVPPTAIPPPGSLDLAFDWVHYYEESATGPRLGAGWYTSIGTSAGSAFVFEATGLTGTTISSVSIVYSGGTPITCTPGGTLTVNPTTGATQGINVATAPYTAPRSDISPLGTNSPRAQTPAGTTLPSGKMLTITITTDTASFPFTKQLFSSTVGTTDIEGTLVWVDGNSTIASDGTSLSGFVGDKDELVITGLKASAASLYPTLVYSSGSTVDERDRDAILGWALGSVGAAVGFYDANTNAVWDVGETVYIDYRAPFGTISAGDQRVTLLSEGGSIFLPWSYVAGGEPDEGRTLTEFPASTRPLQYWTAPGLYKLVYLDKNADSHVSKGDMRISTVLYYDDLGVSATSDLNGFMASKLTIPAIPGGGMQYKVGLWNQGVGIRGVQAGNTVTMQILAKLSATAPTAYQSTQYVTEGFSVTISGNGFFGNEPLTISVGGKYITVITAGPSLSALGVLSDTAITMPALAGGEQSITATGIATSSNTASAKVTYTPALSVYPPSGYNLNPVTSIMAKGLGFEDGTYQIVLDGAGIGEAVTSAFTVADTGDFAGQINIAFNLPEGVGGAHIVDVVKTSDLISSAFYGASYFYNKTTAPVGWTTRPTVPFPTNSEFPTVTIKPSLLAAPTSTIVGSNVTVTGKGLQPSKTYYIWYNPIHGGYLGSTYYTEAVLMITTPTTITTDTKGILSASFQIPASSEGYKGIWVSTSPTFISIDPVSTSRIYAGDYVLYINPALTLAKSSGAVGDNIAVSFSGLYSGDQYQLWWYKPEDTLGRPGRIPNTALLLATATGALYGNSTDVVSFTVPTTAEAGTVYAVDLSYYESGERDSILANPAYFTVGKVATTITLSCTPTIVTQGENVTINGFIEPALSVNITLFIKDPDGKTTNKTITSTSSGTFTDNFKPDKAGTWQVTAKWDGDTTFAAYTSLAATVTVKPIDFSWVYPTVALAIGLIALGTGLFTLYYYLFRKKRAAVTPTTD